MSVGMSQVPVNIYSADGKLVVAALMPALQPEDITVEVRADGGLTIRAELRGRLKDWKDVHQEEWQAGGYSRDLELPMPVDGGAGYATYENGVLVATFPQSDAARPGQFSPRPGQGR
ncbi:MAG TPA: Hsp20/alpha crystallin family protein [Chloroflexaceae bacterium]|nr:Hsp20/alpha crystallin family protein [Chloroflexaceae bacterium]